jgi:RNA polymerase sigma factor (sigma-70 family)
MEKELLDDLKYESDFAYGVLYKSHFQMINRFVNNNNGNLADAEDIFQDTMLILIEKLRNDNFELTASLKTYIMAIAKYLWLNKIRTSYRETELTESHVNNFFEIINQSIEQEKTYADKLRHYLHKITKHCQGLIHDMFFKEKTIEEIQQKYGYSSKHNAINQKHKCIEQIRRVKEKEFQK